VDRRPGSFGVEAVHAGPTVALTVERALRLEKIKPIKASAVTFTFRDLPPGQYAVAVVHDENENGKLDMRWFPIPHPGLTGCSSMACATHGVAASRGGATFGSRTSMR
jgi:uncharacterized protein (DUF2141 family)